MTAEGLPSSRPLSAWMRAIAAGVERVAGEAVEAVGGEDGDAARGDAALERRARRPSRRRARPRPSSLIGSPHHDPLDARPGRAASRPRAKPASRSSSATASACPSPTSSAIDRAGSGSSAQRGEQATRSGVEAVGAGEQRLARLPLA